MSALAAGGFWLPADRGWVSLEGGRPSPTPRSLDHKTMTATHTTVLKAGENAGMPVRVARREGNTLWVTVLTPLPYQVHQDDLEEEPTDRALDNMLFARRLASFGMAFMGEDRNRAVVAASILYFLPAVHTISLPDWARQDTAILEAAIKKGWAGRYEGRDKTFALLMLERSSWVHEDNVPDDQDWVEANVFRHWHLWKFLEPDRREQLAVKFVFRSRADFDLFSPRLQEVKSSVPEHLHVALEEAQAARYGHSDKHRELATLSASLQCKKKRTVQNLRAIPLERLAHVCGRGVAVGLSGFHVARTLRDELRKRKTPLNDISDEVLIFLGTHLPEEEARELAVQTAAVTRKRDMAAFLADERYPTDGLPERAHRPKVARGVRPRPHCCFATRAGTPSGLAEGAPGRLHRPPARTSMTHGSAISKKTRTNLAKQFATQYRESLRDFGEADMAWIAKSIGRISQEDGTELDVEPLLLDAGHDTDGKLSKVEVRSEDGRKMFWEPVPGTENRFKTQIVSINEGRGTVRRFEICVPVDTV